MNSHACSSCRKQFVQELFSGSTPHLLHCGHSCCDGCILNSYKQHGSVTCNVCNKVSKPRNQIIRYVNIKDEFPIFFHRVGELSFLSAARETDEDNIGFVWNPCKEKKNFKIDGVECKECTSENATVYCGKCELELCEKCFDKMHSYKSMKLHVKSPLGNWELREFVAKCEEHITEASECFCVTCSKYICKLCAGRCSNNDHQVVSVEEENQRNIRELEELLPGMTIVGERLRSNRQILVDKNFDHIGESSFINSEYRQTIKDITDYFRQQHAFLQIYEKEMIDKITESKYLLRESAEEVLENMTTSLKDNQRLQKVAKMLLQNKSEAINIKKVVQKVKEHLANPTYLFIPETGNKIAFNFVKPEISYDTFFQDRCTLERDLEKKIKLVNKEDLPEGYTLEEEPDLEVLSESSFTMSLPSRENEEKSVTSETGNILVDGINQCPPNFYESLRQQKDESRPRDVFVKGSCELVKLTEVVSPSEFYVVKRNTHFWFTQRRGAYSKENSRAPLTMDEMTEGEMYLVRFKNFSYLMRARVLKKDESNSSNLILVKFVDTGKTAEIPLERFSIASKHIKSDAEAAVRCALYKCSPQGDNWSEEEIKFFNELTTGRKNDYTMNVLSVLDGIPQVDLNYGNLQSIRTAFLFKIDKKFDDSKFLKIMEGRKELPYRLLDDYIERRAFDVIVTHVISPFYFYVQLKWKKRVVEDLEKRLAAFYRGDDEENKYGVDNPYIGMRVVAKFSKDKKWYRAEIIDLPGNKNFGVFYIDFGNSEILPQNSVRYLSKQFKDIEEQAIPCCLADVKLKDEQKWTMDDKKCMQKLIEDLVFEMFVTKKLRNKLEVVLTSKSKDRSDHRMCLNAALVKTGLVVSTGKYSEEDKVPTYKSFFMAPLAHNQSTVIKPMKNKENQSTSSVTNSNKPIGVTTKKKNNYFQSAKNYNNPIIIPAGSAYKPNYAEKPPRSSLYKQNKTRFKMQKKIEQPKQLKSSTDNSSQNGSINAPVPELSNSNIDSNSISNDNTEGYESDNVREHIQNLNLIKVQVMNCVSPVLIYVRYCDEDAANFDKLQHEMIKFYMNHAEEIYMIREPTIGRNCVVYVKGKWHRGTVGKIISADEVEVIFYDILESMNIPIKELRVILDDFEAFPCLTFSCHLTDLKPAGSSTNWPGYTCDKFKEEISKYCNTYIKKKGEMEDNSQPIELWINYESCLGAIEPVTQEWLNMNDFLISNGLAFPTKSKAPVGKLNGVHVSNGNEESLAKKGVDVNEWLKLSQEIANDPSQVEREEILYDWIEPTPLKSLTIYGKPQSIDLDMNVFMQTAEQADTVNKVNESLNERFENTTFEDCVLWVPGQICIARFQRDNKWYRARIDKFKDDGTVSVCFVDYGNVDDCSIMDLRKPTGYTDIPLLCYKCCTTKIEPITSYSKDWVQFAENSVIDMDCRVDLKIVDDRYVIDTFILDRNVNFYEKLVEMKFARWKSIDCEEMMKASRLDNIHIGLTCNDTNNQYGYPIDDSIVPNRDALDVSILNQSDDYVSLDENGHESDSDVDDEYTMNSLELPVESSFPVMITGVVNVTKIAFRIKEGWNSKCDKYYELLNGIFDDLTSENGIQPLLQPPLQSPIKGKICVVEHEGGWYRGRVIGDDPIVNSELVEIELLDKGLTVFSLVDKLRKIKNKWSKVPSVGLNATLSNVKKNGPFHIVFKSLRDELSGKTFIANVKKRVSKNDVEIDLIDEDGNLVYQNLIDSGLFLTMAD